jgi:hypothetical protein
VCQLSAQSFHFLGKCRRLLLSHCCLPSSCTSLAFDRVVLIALQAGGVQPFLRERGT